MPTSKFPALSPLHRLLQHRPYWLAKMKVMGTICAVTLSILASGYRLDWNPETGPAAPAFQANHPSASKHSQSIHLQGNHHWSLDGHNATLQPQVSHLLPPSGSSSKLSRQAQAHLGRMVVNSFLQVVKFSMETLQMEGHSLFRGCSYGGTFNISQAFHHVDMDPSSYQFLGFEWEGQFYHFTVLPFGLSCAPQIFTLIMQTTVAYL